MHSKVCKKGGVEEQDSVGGGVVGGDQVVRAIEMEF
jgi:hypothetical protein